MKTRPIEFSDSDLTNITLICDYAARFLGQEQAKNGINGVTAAPSMAAYQLAAKAQELLNTPHPVEETPPPPPPAGDNADQVAA